MRQTTSVLPKKMLAGHSKFGTSTIVVERAAAMAESATKKYAEMVSDFGSLYAFTHVGTAANTSAATENQRASIGSPVVCHKAIAASANTKHAMSVFPYFL